MEAFADRAAAGRVLAPLVAARLAPGEPVIVLGLPRGGVPVAREVARALGAPLDVLVVRKLGVPGHEELAFGALATGGVRVINRDVLRSIPLDDVQCDAVTDREAAELARRETRYRGARAAPDVAGRTAIVVDDGLATGATMRAAVQALRALAASRVIVAVPVASVPAIDALEREADALVCVKVPSRFRAVGAWYDDFAEVDDATVRRLLEDASGH